MLWHFCWAATGQGSQAAARDAQEVFDQIFDSSFDEVSRRVTLEYARMRRYVDWDISQELEEILAGDRTLERRPQVDDSEF